MLGHLCKFIFLYTLVILPCLCPASNGNDAPLTCPLPSKKMDLPSLEKEIQKHIRDFGETKEPAHLDQALEKLDGLAIKDDEGNIIPDTAQFRIRNFLTLIHYARGVSNPAFDYSKHSVLSSLANPEEAMSTGSYLYPYVQEGLRARLFSWKIKAIDLIYEATSSLSPAERKDFIQPLIPAKSENFLDYLQPLILSEFALKVKDKINFPSTKDLSFEDQLKQIHKAFDQLGLLNRLSKPGFVPSENWHWKTIPPTGGVAGMSPEGVTHPESRRQYKVALYENSETHQAISLARELQDIQRRAERNTMDFIGKANSYLPEEEEKIRKLAEQYPLNDLFIDSLNELFERKRIKKLITEVEQTGDSLSLDKLLGKLESYPIEKFKSEYLGFKSSFFYESWFNTLLAVRKQGKTNPAFSKRQVEVEDRLIKSILGHYGDKLFYLVEARGYAGMFAATPKVKDALAEARDKKQEEVIRNIDANIKHYRKTGDTNDLKHASRSIHELKHENFNSKIMPELLEKKARWTFELVALAEQWGEKNHSIMDSSVQAMIYAHEKNKKLQSSLFNIIHELAPAYISRKRPDEKWTHDNPDGTTTIYSQKGPENPVAGLKEKWAHKNLTESLSAYIKDGQGNPVEIVAEINTLTDHSTIVKPDGTIPFHEKGNYEIEIQELTNKRFSYYGRLIKGMEQHDSSSAYLVEIKELILEGIRQEYCKYPYKNSELARLSGSLEGTSVHGEIISMIHSIHEAIFNSMETSLTSYRETENLDRVYQSYRSLYYLNFNPKINTEDSRETFNDRKARAFLKLMAGIELENSNLDSLPADKKRLQESLHLRFIMLAHNYYREKNRKTELDSLISDSTLSDLAKETLKNRINEQPY